MFQDDDENDLLVKSTLEAEQSMSQQNCEEEEKRECEGEK